MNNIQKFPHLEQWCKNYYDTVGLKVHPSNVPVDVVLNDLMGFMQATLHRIEMMTTIMEAMSERALHAEERISELEGNLETAFQRLDWIEESLNKKVKK